MVKGTTAHCEPIYKEQLNYKHHKMELQ